LVVVKGAYSAIMHILVALYSICMLGAWRDGRREGSCRGVMEGCRHACTHTSSLLSCASCQWILSLPVLQGLTEEQAVEKCTKGVRVYTKSFTPLKGSIEGSPLKTFIKVLVEEGSERVVGCHMVGEDAPEIIQVSLTDIRGLIQV
jgi:hypothetical protein